VSTLRGLQIQTHFPYRFSQKVVQFENVFLDYSQNRSEVYSLNIEQNFRSAEPNKCYGTTHFIYSLYDHLQRDIVIRKLLN
jgi:hypothetical protein